MTKADELLESLGLSYSELSALEKEEYDKMANALQLQPLTIADFKVYLASLREAIELELEKYDNTKTQDLLLKGRLKNIRLIESFLLGPERAKAAAERSINSKIQKKVGDLV